MAGGVVRGETLVAVYEDEQQASRAAEAARRAGARTVRVGAEPDRVSALQAEMRDEVDQSFLGPGTTFTKDMTKGVLALSLVAGAIGAVLAAPIGLIEFGDMALWTRVLLCAVVGALVAGTVGFVIGGSFGARRPGEELAAERGVAVAAENAQAVRDALAAEHPLRLDVFGATAEPLEAVHTEDDEPDGAGLPYDLGRRMGDRELEQ